jgi:hypothetical protein
MPLPERVRRMQANVDPEARGILFVDQASTLTNSLSITSRLVLARSSHAFTKTTLLT